MERGYINITENDKHDFIVNAKLINGTLWLSKYQMATLFNVYTKTIESLLRSVFKVGLLKEKEVSQLHPFTNNGHKSEMVLYNFEVVVLVGFRVASLEASAFRNWFITSFHECTKLKNMMKAGATTMSIDDLKTVFTVSLN